MDGSSRIASANLIRLCPCFLVQKVSHNGSLAIYRDHFSFYYVNGQEFTDARIPLSSITEMNVGTTIARAMNTIEFRFGDKSVTFSGLRDAATIKDLISLLQQNSTSPRDTIGFAQVQTVTVEKMVNPTLICDFTIALPFEKVVEYIETKESYASVLAWMGQEEIHMGDWVDKPGYRERINQYNRVITVPVFGKNIIPVAETHRIFVEDGVWTFTLRADLRKIPYGDTFEAYEHMIIRNNDDSVEYTVMCDIIWYKSPFVKGIIQTTTLAETQKQFVRFFHQMEQDLLGKRTDGENPQNGSESAAQAVETAGKDDGKFKKIRRLYKVTILMLLLIVVLTIIKWNWPKSGWRVEFPVIYKMVVLGFFVLVLCFF
jgi:hypothetical protein